MQAYIHFLLGHWALALLFVIIFVSWLWVEYIELKNGRKILPAYLVQLMNRENAVVIDIREENVFKQGHILGSLFINPHDLNFNALKKYQARPIILVDHNGLLSAKLMQKFIANGFEKALYLKNGIQAWQQANLPLEKEKEKEKEKSFNKNSDKKNPDKKFHQKPGIIYDKS